MNISNKEKIIYTSLFSTEETNHQQYPFIQYYPYQPLFM